MNGVQLTYARIVDTVSQGEDVFYDIAVQTPSGEIRPGLIQGGRLVTGNGLVFGALIGDATAGWQFVPFGGVEGGGGGPASATFGIIRTSIPIDGSDFAYRYICARVAGSITNSAVTWDPDDDNTFSAYNTTERIGYTDFVPQPIANGVAIIAFQGDDPEDFYFSLSSVEGSCA